jgi:hypothetical protein
MKSLLILLVGTIVMVVIGAPIDAVTGLDLLGFGFQGLVWSTICLIFAVWVLYRLDLLG